MCMRIFRLDRIGFALFVLAGIVGFAPTSASAQTIVWTDTVARKIQRKEVSGGAVETINQFPSGQQLVAIEYDPITAMLYYKRGTLSSPGVFRSRLDGSDEVALPLSNASFFALNVDTREIYWEESGTLIRNRSDLNGALITSYTFPVCCPRAMRPFGDSLFFAGVSTMSKGVWRSDADFSNQQFIHGTSQPVFLAIDPVEGKVFVSTIDTVDRMNLDGSGFESLPIPESGPRQLLVDVHFRKLYWFDVNEKTIKRSNLDGTAIEDYVTASQAGNTNFDVGGLTIVYSPNAIPAASNWSAVVLIGSLGLGGWLVLRRRALGMVAFAENSPPGGGEGSYGSFERGAKNMRTRIEFTDDSLTLRSIAIAALALLCGGGGGRVCAQCDPLSNPGGADAVAVIAPLYASHDIESFGCVQGVQAYYSRGGVCNIGSAALLGDMANNQHPMLTQNLYRISEVGIEQVGLSWVKHDDWAGAGENDTCGTLTCSPLYGSVPSKLGIGCSDIYASCQNGGQAALGPRSRINPASGNWAVDFPSQANAPQLCAPPPCVPGNCEPPYADPNTNIPDCQPPCIDSAAPPSTYWCRLQVGREEMEEENADGLFYLEQQVVASDEQTLEAKSNNVSHQQVAVGVCGAGGCQGSQYFCNGFRACTEGDCVHPLTYTGDTYCQQPAIYAWKETYPDDVDLDVIDVPGDGRLILAARAVEKSPFGWDYEYALYNMNSDRAVGSFELTFSSAVTIRCNRVGFHDISYHSGDGVACENCVCVGGSADGQSCEYAENCPGGSCPGIHRNFDGSDWTHTTCTSGVNMTNLKWETVAHSTSPNANALRWGTLYNFRYRSTSAPHSGGITARIGLFKPPSGTPTGCSGTYPTCQEVTTIGP